MHRLGYQLLARTALARHQDGGVRPCHALYRGQHVHQRLAASDDVAAVKAVVVRQGLVGFLSSCR